MSQDKIKDLVDSIKQGTGTIAPLADEIRHNVDKTLQNAVNGQGILTGAAAQYTHDLLSPPKTPAKPVLQDKTNEGHSH